MIGLYTIQLLSFVQTQLFGVFPTPAAGRFAIPLLFNGDLLISPVNCLIDSMMNAVLLLQQGNFCNRKRLFHKMLSVFPIIWIRLIETSLFMYIFMLQ